MKNKIKNFGSLLAWIVSIIVYGYISSAYNTDYLKIFDNSILELKNDSSIDVNAINFVHSLKDIFASPYTHMIVIAISDWIKYFIVVIILFIIIKINQLVVKEKDNKIYLLDLFNKLLVSFGVLAAYNFLYSIIYRFGFVINEVALNICTTIVYNTCILFEYRKFIFNKNKYKIVYIAWLLVTLYEIVYYVLF